MAPSYSGVWNISTQYQYRTGWPFDANLGTRMLFGGGAGTSNFSDIIDLKITETSGNATDFGNLSVGRILMSSYGSDTKAIWAGGEASGGRGNVIDTVTYSVCDNGGLCDTALVIITISPALPTPTPFGGSLIPIPGKIEVEDYINPTTTSTADEINNQKNNIILVNPLGELNMPSKNFMLNEDENFETNLETIETIILGSKVRLVGIGTGKSYERVVIFIGNIEEPFIRTDAEIEVIDSSYQLIILN